MLSADGGYLTFFLKNSPCFEPFRGQAFSFTHHCLAWLVQMPPVLSTWPLHCLVAGGQLLYKTLCYYTFVLKLRLAERIIFFTTMNENMHNKSMVVWWWQLHSRWLIKMENVNLAQIWIVGHHLHLQVLQDDEYARLIALTRELQKREAEVRFKLSSPPPTFPNYQGKENSQPKFDKKKKIDKYFMFQTPLWNT